MYNGNLPWFLGNGPDLMRHWWGGGIVLLALWSVIFTGLALWHAAKRGEKWWFVIFLFVHTAGILEIIYLVFVANAFATKKKSSRGR